MIISGLERAEIAATILICRNNPQDGLSTMFRGSDTPEPRSRLPRQKERQPIFPRQFCGPSCSWFMSTRDARLAGGIRHWYRPCSGGVCRICSARLEVLLLPCTGRNFTVVVPSSPRRERMISDGRRMRSLLQTFSHSDLVCRVQNCVAAGYTITRMLERVPPSCCCPVDTIS
ncbi:hypothetical protein Micbo1qcDRAFT_8174 [Microdochium bolleyi]|uniref:Uncharacterized protein n=1 Tax=Microdochium bolleyi TaxID=196109 RepID=A0A136JK24_9PEZI|nr:hypothetical protein Micbo1qcDRAFT_8174 [Microdochium bolleyi]